VASAPQSKSSLARSRDHPEYARCVAPSRHRTQRRVLISTSRQGSIELTRFGRAVWPVRFTVDAYGLRIGLRASDASLAGALHDTAPPGARLTDHFPLDGTYSVVVEDGPDGEHHLYEDGQSATHSTSVDELLTALQSRMHFRVAVGSRTRLFVHAGVVGWNGRAILIPGRSGSGKSSLVAALLRSGATYYSDEYAVIDDGGFVHPFPRPLGMRDASGRTHPVAPASFGAHRGTAPLPVGLIVVTRHIAGATWGPMPITSGDAVLALLANTLAAQSRPGDALRMLCAAAASAVAIRGDRGDGQEIAHHLLARSTTPSV
jgi:hypothetical protein